ncbi:hypothetical protein HCU01_08620 [Halomonas cupida]|uniref:Uncharacterized protein n=1 Tax=Halomonas cupida TaxID=44933 RepID=A0A1M7DZA0_9GAMM|nr:hypothetical protein [Halomonas cupida]GEN22913.1 hypothetical protein HCU01_08620 [Halomonas cupida]SHL84825.1 hypothetical protein SAMN05660971_01547 [Halomonas cupida]
MNHFELHEKATTLAESESRYALARRVLILESEHAAIVEETRNTTLSPSVDGSDSAVSDTIQKTLMRLV